MDREQLIEEVSTRAASELKDWIDEHVDDFVHQHAFYLGLELPGDESPEEEAEYDRIMDKVFTKALKDYLPKEVENVASS